MEVVRVVRVMVIVWHAGKGKDISKGNKNGVLSYMVL